MIVASLPEGLRVVVIARRSHRPNLPLNADWCDLKVVWLGEAGWSRALRDAAALKPDLSLFFVDAGFDASAAAKVPGLRLGVVTRPPLEQSGPWPLSDWCGGAVHGLTWFEASVPENLTAHVVSVLPLGVDRGGLHPPDFSKRGVLVSRWAAPSQPVLSHLGTFADLTLLEPSASVEQQLAALDAAGIFLCASHDALGRLDPLPMLALARGLLVISVAPFSPEWGIEAEDEYLMRREDQLVASVDEAMRLPETVRAVRMRAFLKVAEFFDASALFKRLAFDTLARFELHRLLPAPATRARAGGQA